MSTISQDAILLSQFNTSFEQLDKYINQNDNVPKNIELIYELLDLFYQSLTELINGSKKFPGQKILQSTFSSIIKYTDLYSSDERFLLKILKCLSLCYNSKIKSQAFIVSNENVKPLFCVLIQDPNHSEEVFKESTDLFSSFLMNSTFKHEFFAKSGLLFLFLNNHLASQKQNDKDFKTPWALSLFQDHIKDESLKPIEYTDFLQYYSQINPQTTKCLFLVDFFIEFSNKASNIKEFSKIANQHGSFERYIDFISRLQYGSFELDIQYQTQYLLTFYQNPDINYYYVQSLFNANLAIPEIRQQSFNIVSSAFYLEPIYQNNRNLLNEVFPLNKVVTLFNLPDVRFLTFLISLNTCRPEMVQLCLNEFLSKLAFREGNVEIIAQEIIQNSQNETDLSNPILFYSKLYEIIYIQLNMKFINSQQLLKVGFIDIFVVLRHPYIVAHLISKYSEKKFCDLILDLSKMYLASDVRKVENIFGCLLKSSIYIENHVPLFLELVSQILKMDRSESNMKTLLTFIIEHKQSVLFKVLILTISHIEVGQSFIKCGGLETLELALQQQLLTIDKYSIILSHLVLQQRFDELEDFILKLPKTHLLFSNVQNLQQIAYGMNSGNYKPIRVFSLFSYLPPMTEIDPYNAGMLGKFALDNLINELKENQTIYDIPLIKYIGNRYLSPKHVELILKTNPYNIHMFADSSFDHFPLYQLYQSQNELVINQNYSSISFWFKFSDEKKYDERKPEHFFLNDYIKLSINSNNQFMVYYTNNSKSDKLVYSIKINPKKWNLFLLESTEHFMSPTTISVYIDELKFNNDYDGSRTIKSFSFDVPNKGKFTHGKFRQLSQNLLFLGPAIRFFTSQNKNSTRGENLFSLIRMARVGFTYPIREAKEHYLNSSFDIIYYYKDNVISDIDDEILYLPTDMHIKENVKCPPTCVCVPYLGFPSHFISLSTISSTLFRLLKESSSPIEFANILYTTIGIDSINRISSHQFWVSLLGIFDEMIINRPDIISYDVFIVLFQQISNIKIYKYEPKILQKLVLTRNIWDYIDKPIFLQLIFDCFNQVEIAKIIPSFEPFLLDLIINNPTCTNLLLNILIFHQCVPYVVSSLSKILILDNIKRYQSDNEDDIDIKTMSVLLDLRKTIVSSILNFIDNKRAHDVTYYFKIKDLVIYLYNYINHTNDFDEDFACQLFQLIFRIFSLDHSYLNLSFHRLLILNLISLSHNQSIWEAACVLLNGSQTINPTARVQHPDTMFIMLTLLWICLVIITHVTITQTEKKWPQYKFINDFYLKSIQFCKNNAIHIVNSKICLTLLEYMFPIIFTSYYNFSKNSNEKKTQKWTEFYSIDGIDDPQHNSTVAPTLFTKFVGIVLNNFKIPFIDISFTQHDINTMLTPIFFEFSIFLFELIVKNPNQKGVFTTLFSSVLLSIPFNDNECAKIQLSLIPLEFLSHLKSNENYLFLDNFFEYLKFIIAKSPISDTVIALVETILKKDIFIKHYSNQIDEILFYITSRASQESISLLCSLLKKYRKQFEQIVFKFNLDNPKKTNFEWFYLFHSKGIDNREMHFLSEKELHLFEGNAKDVPQNQLDSFTLQSQQFQENIIKRYEQMMEISHVQKAETDFRIQIANYYKYSEELLQSINVSNDNFHQIQIVYADEIKQVMENMDVTLFNLNEEFKWDYLMIQHQINQSNIQRYSQFCPSSQCMPYLYPKLMKPLNYLGNPIDIFLSKFSLEPNSFNINDNMKLKIDKSEMNFSSKLLQVDLKPSGSEFLSSLEVDSISKKDDGFKPTLCTSTKFNLTINNNHIKKHDVYRCFQTYYEKRYGKIENCYNCVFEFFNLTIPSVFVVFANSIVCILTFAEYVKGSNTQLSRIGLITSQTQSNQFKPFLDFVFNQNLVNTSIFMSHVIITIPFFDMIKINLFVRQSDKAYPCILLWTYSMGHIVVSFDRRDMKSIYNSKFINSNLISFSRRSLPNNFLCSIKSTEEAIQRWTDHLITNADLLFFLNASSNYSFITSHNCPIFPSVKNIDLIKDDEFLLNNINIAPFLNDKFKLQITNKQKPRHLISDFDSILFGQFVDSNSVYSISKQIEVDKIVMMKNIILTLSKYEDVLLDNYIIKIIPESMLLQIFELRLSDRSRNFIFLYSKHDPIFYYANRIHSSKNGLFVVIDFDFGLSRAYRVYYGTTPRLSNISIPKEGFNNNGNDKPVSVIISTEFMPFNSIITKTLISSNYMIAASLVNSNYLVLWNVQSLGLVIGNGVPQEGSAAFVYWASSASIHRIISLSTQSINSVLVDSSQLSIDSIELNEISEIEPTNESDSVLTKSFELIASNNDVIDMFQIDENDGIWISSNSKLLFYTFNGEKIAEIETTAFGETEKVMITSLEVCNSISNEPSAIIGLSNGQLLIALIRIDLKCIDFKKLQSMHSSSIKSIFVNQSRSAFVVLDSDGKISHWSVFGNVDSSLNSIHLDRCVICNQKKAVRSCESCNMGICNDCFSQESIKSTGFLQSQACQCKICTAMGKFFS